MEFRAIKDDGRRLLTHRKFAFRGHFKYGCSCLEKEFPPRWLHFSFVWYPSGDFGLCAFTTEDFVCGLSIFPFQGNVGLTTHNQN